MRCAHPAALAFVRLKLGSLRGSIAQMASHALRAPRAGAFDLLKLRPLSMCSASRRDTSSARARVSRQCLSSAPRHHSPPLDGGTCLSCWRSRTRSHGTLLHCAARDICVLCIQVTLSSSGRCHALLRPALAHACAEDQRVCSFHAQSDSACARQRVVALRRIQLGGAVGVDHVGMHMAHTGPKATHDVPGGQQANGSAVVLYW